MIYINSDPHLSLNEAFKRLKINDEKVVFVKSRIVNYDSKLYLIKHTLVFIRSIIQLYDIFLSIIKFRKTIIVREFSNNAMFLFSPILFLCRKHILFNINHNLIDFNLNSFSPIKIMCRMGFRFLLLDGSLAVSSFPKSIRTQFLTPYFPLTRRVNNKSYKISIKKKKRILGIAGNARLKRINLVRIHKIIINLAKFKNWEIRISNSFNTNNDLKNIKNIKFFNTKSHQKYLKFLSSCDAILILANKKDYFYRNSGSIMDSISCGAVPIVHRFPVFISQINKPVKIGFAYKSLEKINEVLSIFNTLIPALIKNRKRYFSERRIVNIDLLN
jgi:hypothetical protein